jgi:hypothetical protein
MIQDHYGPRTASEMNDYGESFAEIARLVRKYKAEPVDE